MNGRTPLPRLRKDPLARPPEKAEGGKEAGSEGRNGVLILATGIAWGIYL